MSKPKALHKFRILRLKNCPEPENQTEDFEKNPDSFIAT